MSEILIAIVLLSAATNGLMEAIKRSPIGDLKVYNEWESIWPLLAAVAMGLPVAIFALEVYWAYGLMGGLLAGALATSVYDAVKSFFKRKINNA